MEFLEEINSEIESIVLSREIALHMVDPSCIPSIPHSHMVS